MKMRELIENLEEAAPAGKAQKALVDFLSGEGKKWGKEHNLSDIPYKFVKVDFGKLMKAAEVLAKKGIIDLKTGDGYVVSLAEGVELAEGMETEESSASRMSDWMEKNTNWSVRRRKYATVVERSTGPGDLEIEPDGKGYIVTVSAQHSVSGDADQAGEKILALAKKAGLVIQ